MYGVAVAASVVLVAAPLGSAAPSTRAHEHTARGTMAVLRVAILGLPRGTRPAVTLIGPHRFRLRLLKPATVKRLAPGRYRLAARRLRARTTTYAPVVASTTVALVAGRRQVKVVRYRRLRVIPVRPAPDPSAGGAGGNDGSSGGSAGSGGGGSSSGGGGGGGGGSSGGGGGGSSSGGAGGGGSGSGSGSSGGGSSGGTTTDAGPTLQTPAPPGFVCSLTSVIAGPPKQIVVTIEDAANGIRTVTTDTTNATAAVSAFTPGSTAPITITATKLDQSLESHLALTITDGNGQQIICS